MTSTLAISSAVLIALDIIPALLTILVNTVFMATLIKTKSLHVPSNVFLGALCMSDLLVGLVVQPTYIAYQISIVLKHESRSLRVMVRYSVRIISGLSFIFASFVTADRYFAICHPFQYRLQATCKRYLIMAALVCIFYCTISPFMLIRRNYFFEGFLIGLLLLAFFGIIASYTRIYRVASKKRRAVINMGTLSDQHSQRERRYEKKERDKIYIIAVILFFLLFCYTPFAVMSIAAITWRREVCIAKQATIIASLWAGCLVVINSCVNSVIYFVLSTEFKAAAKRIFNGHREIRDVNSSNEMDLQTERSMANA